MDMSPYYAAENEKPLDRIPPDGGFAGIFRRIACIGDSLSSGCFEAVHSADRRGFYDYFDHSWGQHLGHLIGSTVFNFSRGGMTAKEYCQSFAEENHFWDEDKLCPCYIIALGVNDLFGLHMPVGSTSDVCLEDPSKNNEETFAGWYARIIQRLKAMQPKARIFLMTMLFNGEEERDKAIREHAALLHDLAKLFEFTYVLDFAKYGPLQDAEYQRNFYLHGHLNAAGYLLTSRMVAAYLDYIIRHNPEDFTQVGFIGTPYHSIEAKW